MKQFNIFMKIKIFVIFLKKIFSKYCYSLNYNINILELTILKISFIKKIYKYWNYYYYLANLNISNIII